MLDDTPESPGWWLIRLGRQIQARRMDLDLWWAYFTGEHPLPELPKKATVAFQAFQRKARTNFCAPVADATVHRLMVLGITDGQGNPDADVLRWWQANRLDSRQKQLYRTVMTQARGYVMVGPHPTRTEPSGRPSPLITLEHPRQAIVEYDPATGEERVGLKAYYDDIARVGRAAVLLGDQVVHYKTTTTRGPGRLPWGRTSWEQDGDPIPHDYGRPPIVEFACRPDLMEEPRAEFAGVIDIQDRINMGVLNRMTAARYSAFRQAWMKGHKFGKRPDPSRPGKFIVDQPFIPGPGNVWASESPDAAFGQLDATDLSGFLKEHESDVRDLLVLSHTPAYYFATDLVNISADTVNALDINHIAKVQEHQATLGESWEAVAELAAAQAGVERDYTMAEVRWADPRQLNPSVLADAAVKKQSIGYPLGVLAEDMGESPQRVKRIVAGAAGQQLLNAAAPPAVPPATGSGQ